MNDLIIMRRTAPGEMESVSKYSDKPFGDMTAEVVAEEFNQMINRAAEAYMKQYGLRVINFMVSFDEKTNFFNTRIMIAK
jgi:hypothetical protein